MSILLLTGCASYGQEELDRLVKEDPRFKQMILQRDQVRSQVRFIKNNLLIKKKAMDAQIDKLRQEYDNFAKAENVKMDRYSAYIQSNKLMLQKEIEGSQAQLKSKLSELEGYQKTLSDVQKVLREGKGLRLSAQERQRWEERILMLSEKIRPLSEEIQELKLQIRLKKQKIYFLN